MANQEIRLPNEYEKALAATGSRALAKHIDQDTLVVKIQEEEDGIVELPRQAIRFLVDILTQMSEGNAITLMPVHKELTTSEAANILNVSRPFLVSLLNEKAIPFHKVGTHRRIKFEDLMDYKISRDSEARGAADELAAESQNLGLDM